MTTSVLTDAGHMLVVGSLDRSATRPPNSSTMLLLEAPWPYLSDSSIHRGVQSQSRKCPEFLPMNRLLYGSATIGRGNHKMLRHRLERQPDVSGVFPAA